MDNVFNASKNIDTKFEAMRHADNIKDAFVDSKDKTLKVPEYINYLKALIDKGKEQRREEILDKFIGGH